MKTKSNVAPRAARSGLQRRPDVGSVILRAVRRAVEVSRCANARRGARGGRSRTRRGGPFGREGGGHRERRVGRLNVPSYRTTCFRLGATQTRNSRKTGPATGPVSIPDEESSAPPVSSESSARSGSCGRSSNRSTYSSMRGSTISNQLGPGPLSAVQGRQGGPKAVTTGTSVRLLAANPESEEKRQRCRRDGSP